MAPTRLKVIDQLKQVKLNQSAVNRAICRDLRYEPRQILIESLSQRIHQPRESQPPHSNRPSQSHQFALSGLVSHLDLPSILWERLVLGARPRSMFPSSCMVSFQS